MDSTLLNIALAVAILGGSAVVTHLFARAMYIRCRECRTLNARRRVLCRHCGQELREGAGGEVAQGRFPSRPASAQKRQS